MRFSLPKFAPYNMMFLPAHHVDNSGSKETFLRVGGPWFCHRYRQGFLISNLDRVLNVVCFLLGNFPASEFYLPTFRNSVCSIIIGIYLPAHEDGTERSETSTYKIQTPGNYPEESTQHRQGSYVYWTVHRCNS